MLKQCVSAGESCSQGKLSLPAAASLACVLVCIAFGKEPFGLVVCVA